jgi:hypothetical protein
LLNWLTDHFSACWLTKWLPGCITARFVCFLEWLIDWVLYVKTGCLIFMFELFSAWSVVCQRLADKGKSFCVINSYSCGPRICCYTARISIVLSNQLWLPQPVQFRIRLSTRTLTFNVNAILKNWWTDWAHGFIRTDFIE